MTGGERRELWVVRLGRVPYAEALELQRRAARARISGAVPQDLLMLVEHPAVVTLGRSSKAPHLLSSAEMLAARGVEMYEVERGGDVTYHGPGQLVGYPIVDLKRHKQDLHWYLRQVEAALIATLGLAGLGGERNPGKTGVWVAGRKIASIGVHARDWVTWHGFALNVTTDLSGFDAIVPCGIAGVEMTSMAKELQLLSEAADLADPGATELQSSASGIAGGTSRGSPRVPPFGAGGTSGAPSRNCTMDDACGFAARSVAQTFGLVALEKSREQLESAIATEPGTTSGVLPRGTAHEPLQHA